MKNRTSLVLGIINLIILALSLIIVHVYINDTFAKIAMTLLGITFITLLVIQIRNYLREQYKSSEEKLHKLIELIDNINEDTSFDGILQHMYHSFLNYIPYSHIGISLLKDNGKIIEASYGISKPEIDLANKLIGIKAELQSTSLFKIIESGQPRIINDLPTSVSNPDTPYNRVVLEAGIKSSLTFPLKLYNKPVGVIFFSHTEKNAYNESHIAFLKTLSNSIAISLYKNLYIDELLYTLVLSLAKLVEARDEDTGEHIERMQKYSAYIAEMLLVDKVFPELTIPMVKEIEKYSPLHDIGKVGVRDDILLKPGKLTEEEYKMMQEHTIYGAKVLKKAEENMLKFDKSIFKVAIDICLGHHEKWNGTGYPFHKKGDEIPLSARIVSVADVFDALTSKRPYKEAFSFEKSIEIIKSESGKSFDPRIVDCLLRHLDGFYNLYKQYHPEIE
ncbi:MAG: HD domain-containing protein [Bacilli bacterium]|nr:HD domain-containing protein [Bacilli bacterium]